MLESVLGLLNVPPDKQVHLRPCCGTAIPSRAKNKPYHKNSVLRSNRQHAQESHAGRMTRGNEYDRKG